MADASERLARWTDPQLGELAWDDHEQEWTGRFEFAGRLVPLSIDTGLREPDRGEQLAVIGPAAALVVRLPAAEPELRRQAAKEVAEAVAEQQDEVELTAHEFAVSLELDRICVAVGAALYYRSPEFFPGHVVTVYGFDCYT